MGNSADAGVSSVAAQAAQAAAQPQQQASSGSMNGNSYFPSSAMADAIQAADNEAKWAYYNKMMELQTVPMTQIAKDQAAAQAAAQAASTALQSANLNLQQLMGAQSAVQAASGLNLQQSLGNQNAVQQAANQQSQEAMGVMNLVAQLRGPQNAFQQQAVMEGMNQSGLSNAIGAITGQYSQGALGRQYGAPQAATLGSLTSDIYGAGGSTGYMSPSQIAMQQALGLQGQNAVGAAMQGAQNLQNQPMVSNSVTPYLNAQGAIAGQTAGWGMGFNPYAPPGGQISATDINSLGTQWGVDPKYIQGYVNANGVMPTSPGTLTQWNQVNGFQSPVDGSYTGQPPVSSVTGYNHASAATGAPVGSASPLNYAQSGYNAMYTGGSIPPTGGTTGSSSGAGVAQGSQSVTNPVSGTSPVASGNGMTYGAPSIDSAANAMNNSYNQAYGQPSTSQSSYGYTPYDYSSSYYYGTPTPPGTLAPGGATNNAYMTSLPTLNNIDVRNYNKLTPDTQAFVGSAYSADGYSTNDVNNAVQKGATPWTAPTYGSAG